MPRGSDDQGPYNRHHLWEDNLAFSVVLQDFPAWIISPGLNMTSGVGPFHDVG